MEFLELLWLGKPVWMWLGFLALVVSLLALDLGVFHRTEREIGIRESLMLSAFYITLGLGFGGWVWWQLGETAALNYVTGFVVEKSLAMDNVFVIAMIFTYFAIPRLYQHRVLFWGILGVIVLRAIMIGLGAALVTEFEWILYLFAAFLIFTGIKMWRMAETEPDIANSPLLGWLRRHLRVTPDLRESAFFVREPDRRTGKLALHATPLFLALVMIGFADLILAVDSIRGILGITTDPFIVYTSNIFAILGLRALFFALSALVDRFHYLKYALAVLLVFIGSKIFAVDALGLAKVPPALSLGVTAVILASGVAYSLWRTRGGQDARPLPGK